jgi:hypothetical protein
VCPDAEGVSNDDRWETQSPFYIHISARADRYIAAHGGRFEGRPRFSSPRQVPCEVALSVALTAMVAWDERWRGDTGTAGVTTDGATARPYLGRFYCTGQTYSTAQYTAGGTYETCTHTGTHVGTIVVEFIISGVIQSQ